MEFLRTSRRRTILSEAAYYTLNILLAVAVLVVVLVVESPVPAFALVILSKWRVFAVRPRYWLAHVVANMVDLIVSLSLVVFLYAATGSFAVQVALTLLYILWLIALKPRSRRSLVIVQAGIGLFAGVGALEQVSYNWWASAVVLGMWLIGYSTARHVLSAYKEPHTSLLSLVWGLVMAELGWMTYHFSFAYSQLGAADLKLSQAALIAVLLSFLAERTYASYHRNQTVRLNDVLLPLLLTISLFLLFAYQDFRFIDSF